MIVLPTFSPEPSISEICAYSSCVAVNCTYTKRYKLLIIKYNKGYQGYVRVP